MCLSHHIQKARYARLEKRLGLIVPAADDTQIATQETC